MDGLTVQDVKIMLEIMLPRRRFDDKEVIKLLESRYKSRNSAWMSSHRL
jgi:hypothetical protein